MKRYVIGDDKVVTSLVHNSLEKAQKYRDNLKKYGRDYLIFKIKEVKEC